MAGKPTIISTNLSLKELEQRYSQRFASRVTGYYGKLEFFGQRRAGAAAPAPGPAEKPPDQKKALSKGAAPLFLRLFPGGLLLLGGSAWPASWPRARRGKQNRIKATSTSKAGSRGGLPVLEHQSPRGAPPPERASPSPAAGTGALPNCAGHGDGFPLWIPFPARLRCRRWRCRCPRPPRTGETLPAPVGAAARAGAAGGTPPFSLRCAVTVYTCRVSPSAAVTVISKDCVAAARA